MLISQIKEGSDLLTPKIKFNYSDVQLVSETPLYHLYEGKSKYAPYPIHTIRAFNFNSQFATKEFAAAASLFIQELLHLISIDPNSVIVNTFEISNGGQKMAFAALPYAPLSCQIPQNKPEEEKKEDQKKEDQKKASKLARFDDVKSVNEMIGDVLLDVEFLSKELKIKDLSSILTPQSIYKFKESGTYFLGDWLTAVIDPTQDMTTSVSTTTFDLSSPPPVFDEMFNLGISIFELNGVDPQKIKRLREIKAKKDEMLEIFIQGILNNLHGISNELRKLLERILNQVQALMAQLETLNQKSQNESLETFSKYANNLPVSEEVLIANAEELELLGSRLWKKISNLRFIEVIMAHLWSYALVFEKEVSAASEKITHLLKIEALVKELGSQFDYEFIERTLKLTSFSAIFLQTDLSNMMKKELSIQQEALNMTCFLFFSLEELKRRYLIDVEKLKQKISLGRGQNAVRKEVGPANAGVLGW